MVQRWWRTRRSRDPLQLGARLVGTSARRGYIVPGELESGVRIDLHARSHCDPGRLCRLSTAASFFVHSTPEQGQRYTQARRKEGDACRLAWNEQGGSPPGNAAALHRANPLVFLNTTSFPFQRISAPRYFTNTFSFTFRSFRFLFLPSFRLPFLFLLGLQHSRSIGLMRQSNAPFLSSAEDLP
jgi:hypothetical protein